MVAIAGGYSLLVSYSVSLIKRGGIEAMDNEEVDTTSMPKRLKIDPGQQLVQAKKGQAKKKKVVKIQQQVDPEMAKLQIQEYVFEGKRGQASKEEWLKSYRDKADKTFEDTSELYREASRLLQPNVALKLVRDHATDTLSLALAAGSKVSRSM